MDSHWVTEYDADGNVVSESEISYEVHEDAAHTQAVMDEAQDDLFEAGARPSVALLHLKWGVAVSGAKIQPNNTDELAFFCFKATIPTDQVRQWWRIAPVIEVGRPWRRGLGYTTTRHGGFTIIRGVWLPFRRPRRPKITKIPERMDISPGRLIGRE